MNAAPIIMQWDTDNKKDIEQAKDIFRTAKYQNRLLENDKGDVIEHFADVVNRGYFRIRAFTPERETIVSLRIINEKGDETIFWDAVDKQQVKEAADKFTDYLGKGWKAYAVTDAGKKHRRIFEFNAEFEEITFEEGFKTKLQDFVKSFKTVKMLPKTYPG